MNKVSSLWRMLSFLVLGMFLGIFISIKYISPPSQDISIGRIKIKGENTITDGIDIQKQDEATEEKAKRKLKIFNR